MLIGGVVDDELGDDLDAVAVGLVQEAAEIVQGPVGRVHGAVVGDVVAVVLERRGVEGQDPQGRDPEVGQVLELLGKPHEIADAVAVGIVEALDVGLVDDRFLVPERLVQGGLSVAGNSRFSVHPRSGWGRSLGPRLFDGDRLARIPRGHTL